MQSVLTSVIKVRKEYMDRKGKAPNYILMGVQEYLSLIAEMLKDTNIRKEVEYKIYDMEIIVVPDSDYIEVGREEIV